MVDTEHVMTYILSTYLFVPMERPMDSDLGDILKQVHEDQDVLHL